MDGLSAELRAFLAGYSHHRTTTGLDLTLIYVEAYNAYLRNDTNTFAKQILAEVECVDVPQVWERCDHPVRATWREVQGMRAIWPCEAAGGKE